MLFSKLLVDRASQRQVVGQYMPGVPSPSLIAKLMYIWCSLADARAFCVWTTLYFYLAVMANFRRRPLFLLILAPLNGPNFT